MYRCAEFERTLADGTGRRLFRSCVVILAAVGSVFPLGAQPIPVDLPLVEGPLYVAVRSVDGAVLRRFVSLDGTLAINLPQVGDHEIHVLQAGTLKVGRGVLRETQSGTSVVVRLVPPNLGADRDGDGLPDLAELIAGTSSSREDLNGDGVVDGFDTDGDGLSDLAEVLQGLDPTDGLSITGLVGSIALPAPGLDVAADGEFLVAAHADGITGFNIFNGMSPTIVLNREILGASCVASAGRLIAVGQGPQGVSIVDATDPQNDVVVDHIPVFELGLSVGAVTAIAAADGYAYVGVDDGRIFALQLVTGAILSELDLGSAPIADLAVAGDKLFAIQSNRLKRITLEPFALASIDQSPTGFAVYNRLTVGKGRAYASALTGVDVFDIAADGPPELIAHDSNCCWAGTALNGPDFMVAARGIVSSNVGVVALDIDPTTAELVFRADQDTPGNVTAIAVANGLAYAVSELGLQVVRYLPFDALGVDPEIALSPSFDPLGVEEGSRVTLLATVADDVQVRNVEFVIDGRTIVDSTFPFEARFTVPRSLDQELFTYRARVFDTGGNFTWTNEVTATVVTDQTPPQVTGRQPSGGVIGPVDSLSVVFNEALDPLTVTPSALTLLGAGVDQQLQTPDDVPIALSGGEVRFVEELSSVLVLPLGGFGVGRHLARLHPVVTDLAGNELSAEQVWSFTVYANTDVDNDGVLDGFVDSDGDGLINAYEAALGLDPTVGDFDPAADSDEDGVLDVLELSFGTDPFAFDSDGDGFSDADELAIGSDPLLPSALPLRVSFCSFEVNNLGNAGLSIEQVTVRNQSNAGFAIEQVILDNNPNP